jgi:hypothetical protein
MGIPEQTLETWPYPRSPCGYRLGMKKLSPLSSPPDPVILSERSASKDPYVLPTAERGFISIHLIDYRFEALHALSSPQRFLRF